MALAVQHGKKKKGKCPLVYIHDIESGKPPKGCTSLACKINKK